MLLPLFTKLEGGSLDRRRTAIGPFAGAMVVRRRPSLCEPEGSPPTSEADGQRKQWLYEATRSSGQTIVPHLV